MQRVTKKNLKMALPMLAAAAAGVWVGIPVQTARADIIASFSDGQLDGLTITGYASQATIGGTLYDDYIVQLTNNGANGTGNDIVGLSATVNTASQNYSSTAGALYINLANETSPGNNPSANVFGSTASNIANSTDPGDSSTDPLAGDAFGYPQAGTFIGTPDGTGTETDYSGFQTKLAYINGNTSINNGGVEGTGEGVGSNVLFKASIKSNAANSTLSAAAVPIDAAYIAGTVHSLETDTAINSATDFTNIAGGGAVANIVVPDGTAFTFYYSAAGDSVGNATNLSPQLGSISNAAVTVTTSVSGPTLSLGSAIGTTVGTVAVTGVGNGNYNPTVVTITPTTTGNVTVSGFNPSTDSEIFALEILEGGASPGADLATIAAQLQTALQAEYPGATVTTTDPTPGGAFKADSFFDIFADIPAPGVGGNTALNFGLTGFTGTSGGAITLAAVGVVPEPTGVGVLALGCLGLMARRRRMAKA